MKMNKHPGFKAVAAKIARRSGVRNAGAILAAATRRVLRQSAPILAFVTFTESAIEILLLFAFFTAPLFAGGTYDCINSKGDYVNYGPPVAPRNEYIVVATDSARYEPRWQAMLDDRDLRALIFPGRPASLQLQFSP